MDITNCLITVPPAKLSWPDVSYPSCRMVVHIKTIDVAPCTIEKNVDQYFPFPCVCLCNIENPVMCYGESFDFLISIPSFGLAVKRYPGRRWNIEGLHKRYGIILDFQRISKKTMKIYNILLASKDNLAKYKPKGDIK